MRSRFRPSPKVEKPDFCVRERGRITNLYLARGGDLVVDQVGNGFAPVYLSHYSNPGVAFFAGLLKFLHESKEEIPKVKVPGRSGNKEYAEMAAYIATDFAAHKFPVRYNYHHGFSPGGMPYTATLSMRFFPTRAPELNVHVGEGEAIILSVKAANKLARAIPRLYPGFECFHSAYSAFLRESATQKAASLLRIASSAGNYGCIQSIS